VTNPFEQRKSPSGSKRRFAIPDSPAVAVVTALITLALAVVLFITAMPDEERVLYYEGSEVGTTELCETTGADGETEQRVCVEVGEFQTRSTGWSIPSVVIAAILAALALVVLAAVPKQLREHRKEEAARLERLTDEDFR
jgi:amino acid transporter